MKVMKNNRGFTLIEVVIALGVLGFGILTMYSMQAMGIRGNATASRITQEAVWSAGGIEKILTVSVEILDDPFFNIDNADDVNALKAIMETEINAGINDPNYTGTVSSLTMHKPIQGMFHVAVNVKNTVNNKDVEFQYMRAIPSQM